MPKILIADDSIAVRKVAERLLTEAGMGVTLAANGSEALALLSKDRPDLIVSDVIMPDKSGYEVCAYIRAQAHLSDVPVLLISGIVNDEVSRQAESCKADGVLKKPFQGTSLKDRVLDLLMKRPAKPAPMSGSSPAQADPLFVEASPAVAPVLVEHDVKTEPCHEPQELPALSVTAGDSTTLLETSFEPIGSLSDERPADSTVLKESSALPDARVKELEEQLDRERRESHDRMHQMQNTLDEQRGQIADLASRHKALDQALSDERAQRAALAAQLEEVQGQARRVEALEAELAEARHRMEQLSQQLSDSAVQASRILELEAHLTAERGAAAQLVQQITALEQIECRAHELETTLAKEREQAETCRKQSAAFEARAARIPDLEQSIERERARIMELDGVIATERETAALVMTQVKQLEPAVQRAHDLDVALAEERERSAQLLKRASEAEQLAEQSNRRFEDMARKLGEIAGLASQLGNGKR